MTAQVGAASCPECGTAYTGGPHCANCGASLSGLVAEEGTKPLETGTMIGTYRILELLGEGGMGRVYIAEHIKLGRRVAIKMLRAEFASNPVAVSRFFAEARAVNEISHENIVEVTDFLDKPGGENCYVMELLRGEDLGRRLLKQRYQPLATSLDIAAQIASALAAVHAAGIIHRDLKPDNIFLVERRGRPNFVKLLDFGVAKLSGASNQGMSTHTTAVGQIIGTPEYMSPEQAAGQPIDHRTDIYALGVILYELVTGQLPFIAKSFGELVIKHMTVPPRRPSTVPGVPHEIPADVELLILDLLAKDAEHRPQTMAEVEQRLRDILDGMDVPVPREWLPSGSMRIPVIQGPDAARRSGPQAVVATAPTLDSGPIARIPTGDLASAPEPLRRGAPWKLIALAAVPVIALVAFFALRGGGEAPAKPATPAPAAPQVAPAPPPATEVTIQFASTPDGATVRLAGSDAVLGTTPFRATFPRATSETIVVEVTKPGYAPATQTIGLAADGAIAVALAAAPATAQKPPAKARSTKPKKTKPVDKGGTMSVFGP